MLLKLPSFSVFNLDTKIGVSEIKSKSLVLQGFFIFQQQFFLKTKLAKRVESSSSIVVLHSPVIVVPYQRPPRRFGGWRKSGSDRKESTSTGPTCPFFSLWSQAWETITMVESWNAEMFEVFILWIF